LFSVFLFSKLALESVGGFDEALPSSIDHDIWMSLAVYGCHADVVDELLVITYERRGISKMMSDTHHRICGVRKFVENGSQLTRYGLERSEAQHMPNAISPV